MHEHVPGVADAEGDLWRPGIGGLLGHSRGAALGRGLGPGTAHTEVVGQEPGGDRQDGQGRGGRDRTAPAPSMRNLHRRGQAVTAMRLARKHRRIGDRLGVTCVLRVLGAALT